MRNVAHLKCLSGREYPAHDIAIIVLNFKSRYEMILHGAYSHSLVSICTNTKHSLIEKLLMIYEYLEQITKIHVLTFM